MGNPFVGSAGTAGKSTTAEDNLYKQYIQALPGMQNAANQQLLPTAQAELNTNMATTPIQNALNLQQLDQYGLPTAAANSAVTNQNALLGAQTNLNTIMGPGGATAMAAQNLNRATNPDYWNNADAASNQSVNGLNAINLNGLSPGEGNAVERSLNQTNASSGNLGLNNATNTVSNAMDFGGAFNSKLGILQNQLGAASGVGNMLQNNGFNSTSTALGAPSAANQSQFGSGSFGSTGTTGASNMSSNLLGQNGSLVNSFTAPQAQSNFQNSAAGMFQTNASACCFIFMEAYHGEMPVWVRKCRDKYYTRHPQIAIGYKRMAKVLVPLMRKSKIVRQLTWKYMINPLTRHGYSVVYSGLGQEDKKSRTFWMKTWYILGY